MKLDKPPELQVSKGLVPNDPPNSTRRAVFLEVQYSYECSSSEVDFIEQNDLVILEKVTIVGFNPTNPGNDIDLAFSIRPQFTANPLEQADANFLRANSFKVNRQRRLFVLESEMLKALNVNNLMLDSVKVNVQLIYTHIGISKAQKI